MAAEMPSKEFLLEQIARAKRFAAGLTSKDDRDRLDKIAADYQSQLDAAEVSRVYCCPGDIIGSRRALE